MQFPTTKSASGLLLIPVVAVLAAAAAEAGILTAPSAAIATGDIFGMAEGILALPMPKPTVPPRVDPRIWARQAATSGSVVTITQNTCGFFDGDISSAWSCNDQALTCSPSGNRIACCSGVGTDSCAPNTFTACIPLSQSSATVCPVDANTSGTICCFSSNAINCVTNLWITGGSTATAIGCAQSWSGLITLSNFPDDGTSYVRQDKVTTTTSSSSSSSTAPIRPSTTTITSSSPTSTGGGGGGGSSTSVGPIVGGVVGGLAVIGLVVLGVVYLLRKNKAEPHEQQPLAQHPPAPSHGYPSPTSWGGSNPSPMQMQVGGGGTETGVAPGAAGACFTPQTSPGYWLQTQQGWGQPVQEHKLPPASGRPVELA